MFSFFDLFRRRFASARPATAKRKNSPRRRQLRLEALEERWVPSTYSIGSSFNSTAIAAGNSIWFTSIASGVSGVGATPATVTVTNQTITFTDSTGGTFNESLPNAVLTFTPGGTSATTTYNTTLNEWVTNVPSNIGGNVFLSAFGLALPSGLHGSDNPVTWSGQFVTSTSGLKFNWAWAATGYTGSSSDYSSVYGSLNVKPCDNNTSSIYNNNDKAGSPEGYTSGVIAGAKGTGGTNYVGSYTGNTQVIPTYSATLVSIAGTVYNDANNNGVFDYNSSTNPNETGIGGVTLTLTGTTTGGLAITPATTTTAANGTYTFSSDGSGNSLVAGTYQIVETEPAGYYQGSDNIGTVSGTADGTLTTVDTIGSIALTAGQNGINYNFGEVDPFSTASVPYPYASGTANTNLAFNESEIMYGASVNLATSTLDLFYSDEHALTLGVSQVTANGTTTNYPIAQMPANSSTSSAINPAVGDTTVTGTQAAVDSSGRPLFPSLFVTDITNNPTSTSGDWQFGGTAITPSAIYGSWKSYTLSISGGTVTQSGGTDPATANGWTLPAGADPVPASIAGSNAGYGTEIQWSLASLYSSGTMIPGHNYRFYFIVHDGDQNRVGGDVGQAAFDFTYRGPVTIAGNVYNDVYGNGVDGAGDNGIGGVNLTLTGTTASGTSVTATTTTAANGAYTFTTDSNGNLLRGGTYKVTETPPSGYLPGIDTVGLTSWTTGFQTVLANTNSGGTGNNPGYVHDVVNSASDSIFTGTGSLDTNSITKWQKTTGQPAATNDIADAFGDTFNDSLTGHTFLLSGMDRYSSTSATTVGFWDFQNSVSVNANGTFSGVHTNGDLFFVVNVSVYGATSVAVYEWTGTDSTGSLTAITPPVGATDVFVNTSSVSVPWTFADSTGNTSPQAGEFLEIGVDLNAVYGLTVPHFTSFLTETRSGNTSGSSLLDFALGTLNTVSGSFTADGSLVPPAAIGSIVASDGQNGINYNFGEVQPVTIGGQVYQDTNGNGALDSGEPGIGGVTLTLTGTSNLGKPVTATTTTAANGTYSFTTYNSGQFIPPGTYQIVETPPSGYLAGATTVGTVNSTADGTVVTSGTIGSIVETTGQNGINYNFGEVKPVTVSGLVYQDTHGTGVYNASDPGIGSITLTLSGNNGLGQSITATTTTASNGTYSFTTDSNGNALRPGSYTVTETQPSGYLAGATSVGTVNGTADGTVVSAGQIGSIAMTSGQSGINYNFGEVKPVTVSGLVYSDNNGSGVYNSNDLGIGGVTLTLSGTNGLGQAITATTTTAVSDGTYTFSTDSNGNALLPGTYQIVETQPTGYFAGAAAVGTVNGTADGTVSSATKIISVAMTSGQSGINYLFGDLKGVTISGTVYQDTPGNGTYGSSDPGVAGVTLTLTGTNNLGQSITATTVSGANGTYTFNADSNGNPLLPGTYKVTETIPSGYLPGSNFVGTLIGTPDNFAQGFTQALTASGPGYTHNSALNSFKNGSSDTAGVSTWGWQQSNVPQKDLLLDGFASTYNDPSGDELLLASADRYANNGDSTVGFWFFQNSVSLNANGTFNGTHTNGDILVVDDFSGSLGTLGVYEWVGTDATGTLKQLTPPAGSTYFFTNTSPFSVPWSFTDSTGNTSPQAGEYMAIGLDLNAILGSSVPHYTSTLVESRASNSTTAELKSFLLGGINAVVGSNQPDGTLVGTNTITAIVATSGVTGINYNFGLVKPVTISGTVYNDTNGTGVYNASDPGISGVTLTLSGTNNLGQSITATATTAANGTYSFTTDSSGNQLRPGTYQVIETQPSGYLLGSAAVGTVNGTADGTVSSATNINSIALTSGQAGINYLFGDVKAITVSGLVYQDSNDNGLLDTGEPGIAGVTLTLTGTNGMGQAITATTTTAANGTYSFTIDSSSNPLRPGTYQVAETLASGYLAGTNKVGTVNGTADGTLLTGNKIGSIAVTSGQSGINYNFGEVKPVTISGTVYQDSNDNGLLDTGEPGMSGVTLTLTGTNGMGASITATTTTAAGGTYSFTTDSNGNPLLPGTYQVAETLASGYLAGTNKVGTVNGTTDGTLLTGNKIGSIAVTSGQSGINYNFGEVQPVTISGLVYQDNNDNGLLDTGEPGMSGVTLTLSGTNGMGTSITATTTTAANGTYSFATDSSGNPLLPGTYQVAETLASGFLAGTNAVGTVNGTADGALLTGNKIGSIAVTSGQSGINYNFGEVKPVTISGLVYQDTNDNGVLNTGEPGISGVTLTLTGTNGMGQAITATATTAAGGTYTFTTDSSGNALLPGTYQIAETLASGFLAGTNAVGTVNGTADGALLTGNKIGSIAVTSGQSGINYNFGEVQPVTISGLVYQDSNDNGVLNTGEPGMSGVTLTLTGTNGMGASITATATTAAGGTFTFTTDSSGNALLPGTYQIAETLASGFLAGTNAVGTVNGTTDGSLLTGNKIGSIAVTSGQNGVHYNFGEVKPVTISGTVYQDSNDNGLFDTGEPGMSGVTLTLTGTNGMGTSITATTTTAANGTYSFTTDSSGNALLPGTYQVAETLASGFLAATNAVGTVNGTADGALLAGNKIGSIAVTSGQSGINYNFGEVQPVTISGLVYQDTNGNGLLDSGEPGMSGVTLTLSGTNGMGTAITATTTTAAGGTYSFTTDSHGLQLLPGTYQVAETLASGFLAGTNKVGTVNGTADGALLTGNKIGSIAVTSNQNGINYNFGEVKPVTISGLVYQDTNDNSVLDSGEPGIAVVTLTLTGTNGMGQAITATTTTNASGGYTFITDSNGNALLPGTYQVAETLASGFLAGTNKVGTVSGTADGTLLTGNKIGSIAVTSGQSGINYNFGEVQPVTISGLVYQDSNDNGLLDTGEPGIGSVSLTLSGTNGMGQAITATTTTAVNGTYSFTTDSNGNPLLPGTYQVAETLASGFLAGTNKVGTVNGTTDGSLLTGNKIGSIGLTSGQNGINYNFGEVQPVTISGIVYEDKNGNGVLDTGEPGIAGVTLTLSGTNGMGTAITATTTTAANGTYSFATDSSGNPLLPGTYQVAETLASGFLAGTNAVGTVNGSSDGTLLSGNKIGSIGMTSGQSGINYNFGEVKPVTISGLVYQDTNDNGLLDSGEPGLAGVTLTLSGTNNLGQSVTATTTTASNGMYSFSTDSNGNLLAPGTYQVAETVASGYLAGTNAVGTVSGSSDGTLLSGNKIGSIGMTSGQSGINYNFGEFKPVTISGTVYQDMNWNGVLDAGEPGIAGVTLTLSGTSNLGQTVTATTTTAADGTYSFMIDSNGNPLLPGTYQVAETQPTGYLQGFNTVGTVNGTTDGTLIPTDMIGNIMMSSSQSGINYNFGEVQPVTISGTVYLDSNANGVQDSGEPGIAGVTLTLSGTTYQGQTVTATTTTAADGTYSFTTDSNGNVLLPGTYQVVKTPPSGYLEGASSVGTVNGNADGTANSVDKIGSIAMKSGQNGINYNFSEVLPVTISGLVYEDKNDNGVLDSGEPVIANVVLTLSGTNNIGQAVSVTTTTNANGAYTFSTDGNGNSLAPGTYQISETTPSGYVAVTANVGTVNGTTDGTKASPSKLTSIALGSGQSGINYDFGLNVPASVSGYVYVDYDRDGKFDNSDAGLAGQIVTLTGVNILGQSVTLTVTTDANGYYIFANVIPVTYTITLTPPGGIYNPEVANAGTVSGTSDGTANASNLEIDQVVLHSGDKGVNYDFGVQRPLE